MSSIVSKLQKIVENKNTKHFQLSYNGNYDYYNNLIKFPNDNDDKTNNSFLNMSDIEYDKFKHTSSDKTFTNIKIHRNMRYGRSNGTYKNQEYEVDVYSKDYYSQKSFNKKDFAKYLYNDVEIDIGKKLIDDHILKTKRLSDLVQISNPYINDKEALNIANRIKPNVLKSLFEKYDKISLSEEISKIIFDNSNLYYSMMINIFVRSLDDLFKEIGIRINTEITRLLFESAFIFNSGDNFGVIYKTIDYISKELNVSVSSVTNTLRKLEFSGVISYIAGDKEIQKKEITKYLNNLKSFSSVKYNDMSISKYYSLMYRETITNKLGVLLFPVINFDVLANYLSEHHIGKTFDLLKKQAIKSIKKSLPEFSNDDILHEISKYTNRFNEEEHLKDRVKKRESNKKNNDLYDIYTNNYKKFVNNNFEIKFINSGNDDGIKDFFIDRKITGYTTKTMLEDSYFMNHFVKSVFKEYYFSKYGKHVKNINIKRFPIDNEFNLFFKRFIKGKIFGDCVDIDYRYLHSYMIHDYIKGMWNVYGYKKDGIKFTSRDKILEYINTGIDKEFMNIGDYLPKECNTILNRIIKRGKLNKSKIFNSKMPIFNLIKYVYPKINNKRMFFRMMYRSFVNSNKSQIIQLHNLKSFFEFIEFNLIYKK